MTATSTTKETRRIVLHGRVQGVGFRMTTRSIARGRPVHGYVKNMHDGTVELVVTGESGAIDEFLNNIEARFKGNIEDRTVEEIEATEEFNGFEIR